MTRFIVVEAHSFLLSFGFRRPNSFPSAYISNLAFNIRSNLILRLGFRLSFHTIFLLNHQNWSSLFNDLLGIFKHPMQLGQCLLHAMHVEIYDKLIIVTRQ